MLFNRRLIIIGIATLLVSVAFILVWKAGFTATNRPQAGSEQVKTPTAQFKVDIGKEFAFPLKDDQGKEISKISYLLNSGEIRDEIIIKGQRVSAAPGKTFLILNIKLKNDSNRIIKVSTRDYIRLSSDNQEWFAPDIHSDPVEVQPISVKYAKIGFQVSENTKKFKVQSGEINGEKTLFDLTFN